MRWRAIRLFTSKISESIAEGAQLMSDKQIADMTAATEQAQAREAQNAEDAASALEIRAQEAAAASDLADIGEDISMEEVLGPGRIRSRSPTKKPRPTFQKWRARRFSSTQLIEYLVLVKTGHVNI